MKVIRILPALLLFTFVTQCGVGSSGSGDSSRRSADAETRVRTMLIEELRKRLSAVMQAPRIDSAALVIQRAPSDVVPGLVYYWGEHRYPTAHSLSSAVVALRSDSVRPIASVSDWEDVVRDWAPRSGGEAKRACLELAHVLYDEVANYHPTWYDGSLPAEANLLEAHTVLLKDRLGSTAVTVDSSRSAEWRIDGWLLDPHPTYLAVRYQCTLTNVPSNGSRVAVDLRPIDTLVIRP
jgi:hypothetical protein